MNARRPSSETLAVASRVARALGLREGTTPEDNPLLREQRVEGGAEANASTARELLHRRAVEVSAVFLADLPIADRTLLRQAAPAAVAAAALTARSLLDFLHRLRELEES